MNMEENLFKDKLFETFLDFQRKTRKFGVTAFANYLTTQNKYGVKFSQQLVSGWLNGDFKPSEKYAPALADIMGDYIFDILKIPRPSPDLQILTTIWDFIPSEKQRILREQGEQYKKNKTMKDL